MSNLKQKLLVEQADRKLSAFRSIKNVSVPHKGWINSIRVALNMSLRQLGERLDISPQSVKEIEEREANGSITLKGLKEAGEALELKLVYGFVPKNKSIEKMIESHALDIARDIVMRTSGTMQLEGQGNSKKRIERAIKDRAEEIKKELPKYLWELK